MNTKRTHFLWWITLAVACTSGVCFVYFFSMIQKTNERTSLTLSTLEKYMTKQRNSKALSDRVKELAPIQKKLASYIVHPAEIDGFVSYLETSGTIAGTVVSVDGVEVIPSQKNIITVRMSIEGEFSKVLQTQELIENAPYKIAFTRTYLTKRLKTVTRIVKGASRVTEVPLWRNEITFTVVSS
jgi:hypothetical protein